jgi:YVTN family beta-propeller protein
VGFVANGVAVNANVAVNPNTNRVYVTHAKRNYVSVVDGTTNRMIANISSLPILTDGVVADPRLDRIYVSGTSNKNSNSVLVIDGERKL